jgi:hypothetical protein
MKSAIDRHHQETIKGLKPLPCKAFSKASPILEVEMRGTDNG